MVYFLFNTFSHSEVVLLLCLTGYLTFYASVLASSYFSSGFFVAFFGISHKVLWI